MKTSFYTQKTKAFDLLADEPILISLVERLGFHLGFGDATIQELCSRMNFPLDLFLSMVNLSIVEDYRPDVSGMGAVEASLIMKYIRASHEDYSTVSLPHLHSLVHKMLEGNNSPAADILNKFFDDFASEIDAHFVEEEKMLLRYEKGLTPHFAKHEHAFLDKLRDLKNIVIKYLPADFSENYRFLMLRHLVGMEADLMMHARIEETMMTPLLLKLSPDE